MLFSVFFVWYRRCQLQVRKGTERCSRLLCALLMACLSLHTIPAQAGPNVENISLRKASNEVLLLSATIPFELPVTVEQALKKGLAVVFTVEAKVVKKRWYWSDEDITQAQRYFRLSYLPLEEQWRVQIGLGQFTPLGISISNKYDNLDRALGSMQRITDWAIALSKPMDMDQQYQLQFDYKLNTEQLPRAMQIGLLGNNDWELNISKRTSFSLSQLPG